MISDRQLMRLSLIIAIVGVAALFLLTVFIEPRQTDIADINESMIGQNIMVNCIVESVYVNNAVFLVVSDGEKITAVALDRFAKEKAMQLKAGDKVIVRGKVELYKGELEILISDVKLRYD